MAETGSVLAHLQAFGELTDTGVELVYRTVAQVLRSQGFPPPAGKGSWDEEAVTEAAHDFVSEHLLGKRRLDSLMLRATSEESFERLLRTTVVNFFRDRARATARGALIRRLGGLLGEDPAFRLWREGATRYGHDSLWGLVEWDDPSPFSHEPQSLVIASWAIAGIRIVRWRPTAARRSPPTDRDSLIRFLKGVFEAAEGTMSVPEIGEVAFHRFALREAPAFVSLDDPAEQVVVNDRVVSPEEDVGARASASAVLEQLSERERSVLIRLGESDFRSIATELGMAKSTVFDAVRRIRRLVGAPVDQDDDAPSVMRELERMATGEAP